MLCTSCGRELDDNYKFCPSCGVQCQVINIEKQARPTLPPVLSQHGENIAVGGKKFNRAVLKGIINKWNIDGGFYIDGSIPEKKLKNAIEKYSIPYNESVIGLIDTTLMGSAKNGLALCLNGIYWRELLGSAQKILYSDLSKKYIATIKQSTITLLEKDSKTEINLAGSNVDPIILKKLLNDITYAQGYEVKSIDEIINDIGVVKEIKDYLDTFNEDDKAWLIAILTPLSDTYRASELFSVMGYFCWTNGSLTHFWKNPIQKSEGDPIKAKLINVLDLLCYARENIGNDSKNIRTMFFSKEFVPIIFFDDRVVYYDSNGKEISLQYYKNLSDISVLDDHDNQAEKSLYFTRKVNSNFSCCPFSGIQRIIYDEQSGVALELLFNDLIENRRKLSKIVFLRSDMGCVATDMQTLVLWSVEQENTIEWTINEISFTDIDTIFLDSRYYKNLARFILADSYFDVTIMSNLERERLYEIRDAIEAIHNRKLFHVHGVTLLERYWLYEFPEIIKIISKENLIESEEIVKSLIVANTYKMKGKDLAANIGIKVGLNLIVAGLGLAGNPSSIAAVVKGYGQDAYETIKQTKKFIGSKFKPMDYSEQPFMIITDTRVVYYDAGLKINYAKYLITGDIPFIIEEDDATVNGMNIYENKNGKKGLLLIKMCDKSMAENAMDIIRSNINNISKESLS